MFAAGQSIGNYRILQKIGTGGMGAVYLAEHPLIGKRVAMKVIHRELAGNREVVQRFFQEARAVNQIGNEHIVEVHDFGVTPEGDHFYIMEHIDGRTLASVLTREHAIEVMRALHIGAQIAHALGAAHSTGIIHRDLKPDNIMLVTRLGDPDFVKVLDFGLAKMFQGHGAGAVQTAAGVLLGTPQYMSPEACESKRDLDHRTDIYALGVLLFQMITGVLPFDGDSMGEVLVKQVTQLPPAPRGLNPAIPPSVEQIVLRCLAKAPDARFSSMSELRGALLDPESYLHASPPIAAARSVAPGQAPADARQVMAAADARARMLREQAAAGNPNLTAQRTIVYGGAAPVPSPRAPGAAHPATPKLDTMRIATPVGYSSSPPRKVWPLILGVGLLLGIGGGAFAVVWFGNSGGKPVDTAPGSAAPGSAAPARTPPPPDAAIAARPPAPDAAIATTKMVKLSIDSIPPGATVSGPDGAALPGETPLVAEWPASTDPVKLTLTLRGYRDKVIELDVTQNVAMRVPLTKARTASPKDRPSTTEVKGMTGRDGLERPE